MSSRPPLPRRLWMLALLGLWACSGPQGCACAAWTPELQGTFQGQKLDTAAAVRLSGGGFATLNANSQQILDLFAPGGVMQVPVSCSIQSINVFGIGLASLTVGDQGGFGCTSTSCGRMDGKCDAQDLPQMVNIQFTSLQLVPVAPDVVKAVVKAKVQTGLLFLSSVSRSSPLCALFGGGAVMCSIDFDTARATPVDNEIAINIELTIDQRWDKLLALKVKSLDGTKACGSSGALPSPQCFDPADIAIASAGPSCSGFCTGVNIGAVKSLMLDQLTKSLQQQVDQALAGANCAPCGPQGECPQTAQASSVCAVDGGTSASDAGADCIDTTTTACVPAMIGTEGVIDVGTALAGAGAPPGAGLELALAAGGGAEANTDGATIGVRGGFKATHVADCVKPETFPTPAALPLPDFDSSAGGPYDVAFSLSQQALSQAFFQAQQSGALCLELGQESISLLDSSALAALLPSLGKLTQGESVPLRVVIRPVHAPTAVLGAGTFDSTGAILDPLVTLSWQGVEIDVYARLWDRYARLFTLSADLSLPFALTLDGCSGLTPVLGGLSSGVTNVQVKNSEILAEKLDVLKALVPTLLAQAEPALAKGFQKFTLPEVQGFQVQLTEAKGVGPITGTKTFNHLGVYAKLLPPFPVCVVTPKPLPPPHRVSQGKGRATVFVPGANRVSVRVDGGFWSPWRTLAGGMLEVEHPRLLLVGEHVLELRTPEGGFAQVVLPKE